MLFVILLDRMTWSKMADEMLCHLRHFQIKYFTSAEDVFDRVMFVICQSLKIFSGYLFYHNFTHDVLYILHFY